MNRVIIATILMAASSIAAAAGPYVGAGLGWSDTQYTYIEKEDGFGDVNTDIGVSGPAASLFGGYRVELSGDLFLSFEANVALSTAKAEDKFETFRFKAEQETGYGVAALLGTRLGDGAVYGRLGYQMTNYKISISDTGFSDSRDETHSGVRLGLGAELPLDNGLILRLDWSRTWYSEETYFSAPGFSIGFEPEESLFQAGLLVKI